MKSTVEPLEGSKVKVSVTIDEADLQPAIDSAFQRLAKEVRLPGFRPGKVPRKVLEARIGKDGVRGDALQEALPQFYSEAVIEHNVDVIDQPEFDVSEGLEGGPVTFDAVVEVRPKITIEGYDKLKIEIPRPTPTDEEVQAQVDRLREQHAELNEVERPAADGDNVTIDVTGRVDDEEHDVIDADDFLYEVGSDTVVPELDENLRGAKVGDILEFTATHPSTEDEITFKVLVKKVQEKVLPDETDEWAAEASEFDTFDELKADIVNRLTTSRTQQAVEALRTKTAEALAELVDDDLVPEAMVRAEMRQGLENMQMQLQSSNLSFEQFMAITGTDQDAFRAQLEEQGKTNSKVDLALRALAEAENIEVDDAALDDEIAHIAYHVDDEPSKVRERLEHGGQLEAVRSDVKKRQALDWLIEQVEVVDEDGEPVDRDLLDVPDDHADHRAVDHDHDHDADAPADESDAQTDTDTDSEEDSE